MEEQLKPGSRLLTDVRSCLIAKGTSLHRWCHDNSVLYPNARQALIGSWNGPKGVALRNKIINAAGLDE